MSKYPRGSEWRKWDLHVHTPCSLVNYYSGADEKWEQFIADLGNLPREFSVIGINDYLFIDGYKKVLDYKNNGRLNNIELILPVFEFRIKKFAGHKDFKRINFHVIFSDELSSDIIEQQFLNALTCKYTLSSPGGNSWSGTITKDSLSELGKKIKEKIPEEILSKYGSDLEKGFNNLNLDEENILDILNKNTFLKGKFLTAIGKTEWESLSWNEQSIAEKKDIINKVDLIFISSNDVNAFHNAKNKLTEQRVNNLLLDCSDAHYNSDANEKDRIGKCFTWIKADPTFEGLKQIIYEPEDRVRIQEKNPQDDYPKPFFSNIGIQETKIFADSKVQFDKLEHLPLNQNLVAIIGGRGTGKSLLLDAIAKTFDKTENNTRASDINIENEKFNITYQKSDEENTKYSIQSNNPLYYLHIHQGEVNNIVHPKEPEKLDSEIKKLLNLSEIKESKDNSEVNRLINDVFEIKEFLNKKDADGNLINSIEYNESKIKEKQQLIDSITTTKNKELIAQYTKNLDSINKTKKYISELEQFKKDLTDFQEDKNQFISNFNQNITEGSDKIPEINFSPQLDQIPELKESLETKQESLVKDNQEIISEFKEQGITGDITTLLEQVENYQNEINDLQQKIDEINRKEEDLGLTFQNITDFVDSIIESHEKYSKSIKEKWKELKEGKEDWDDKQKSLVKNLLEDIEIEDYEKFDDVKFYDLIKDSLNLTKFRESANQKQSEKIKEVFNIHTKDDFIKLIKDEPIINLNGNFIKLSQALDQDIFNKDGAKNFMKKILLKKVREEYWDIITKTKYKNKEMHQLSVGMKGTFYVCLKLATDSFLTPFIFDQPEDDLDNNFIMTELVPIFKKIKKYRQVIIVTHNANLVINADAEQVIIAENNDEKLSYVSGSIECTDIRKEICNILEGGKEAFEKREKKYGFR